MMSDRLKLFLLLLPAFAQGVLYMVIVPPWQHYDEPTHFEYAWLTADLDRLPEPSETETLMRREVFSSMVRYDFFDGVPPQWLTDTGQVWLGILELTHPPAYYAYLAAGLNLIPYLDVTTQMYLARAMTVLLYLGTVALLYLIAAELTPRGHMLRWLVPLTAILIGPFANQMTAVNNDAAAAFSLTLFFLIAVRVIRRGFSWFGLLLLVLSALLAVFSKNTTALAVALMPHVFILVFWVRKALPWRWFWIGTVVVAAIFVFLFFEWGDAAYWYRYDLTSVQHAPTRDKAPPEASYPYAIRTTVDAQVSNRKLLNPLFPAQVRAIAGKEITVGGWVWASEPQEIYSPGMLISNRGSYEFIPLTEPITVTTTPTFVHATYTVPEEAVVAYYSLFADTALRRDALFELYLQGAFIIEGAYPENLDVPQLGEPLPDEIVNRNLIRNGDASQGWPRLRTWVEDAFNYYLRRSPSYLLSALLDVERNAPYLLQTVAPYLLNDLFVAYGWGHVRIGQPWWVYGFAALVAVCAVGVVAWLWRGAGKRNDTLVPAISVLAVAGILVWIAALTWPLPYNWARVTLPSARYTFATIAPTAFFLAGGWWAVLSPRWRTPGIVFFVVALALLNLAGVWRIIEYYSG